MTSPHHDTGIHDHDQPFGWALKRHREARRVSQSRLAERAGFDRSYVSRIESGSRYPSRDAVCQLAEALGLDTAARDELLAMGGFMPDDVASLLSAEPELAVVLDLLRSETLAAPSREAMRQVLRSLVELARNETAMIEREVPA